jgi:hypothetical protein
VRKYVLDVLKISKAMMKAKKKEGSGLTGAMTNVKR